MSLIVHIQDLKEHPVTLEINHKPAFFEIEDDEFSFRDNIIGEVTFTLVGKNVLAKGWLSTKVYTHCVRCLEEFSLTLNAPVELVFENDPKLLEPPLDFDPTAEIINYFDGSIIDPKEVLRELIMLELPYLAYCKPDCKGLCQRCGTNLNNGTCSCPPQSKTDTKTQPEWKQVLRQIKL